VCLCSLRGQLIILIVLSMGILEHTRQVTVSRILGVFIAFIAIVWYSVFKLQEAQKKAAAKVSDIKQPLAAAPAEGTPLVKK
jgi:F0F1-type ATP synthase assembly protein I